MKPANSVLSTSLRLALALPLASMLGCASESPTDVVVDNDYPAALDGGDPTAEITVYKVWWVTTLMPDAVGPAAEGQPQRTVPNADFAYAVLAPGWDPRSAAPPSRFVAAKSVTSLRVDRGATLHVHVSDATFDGNCANGKPLSPEEARFITASVFPAEFAGLIYDATTCTTSPIADAGLDGTTAGADAASQDTFAGSAADRD